MCKAQCTFPEILYLPTHVMYVSQACRSEKSIAYTHSGEFHTQGLQFRTTCSVAIKTIKFNFAQNKLVNRILNNKLKDGAKI